MSDIADTVEAEQAAIPHTVYSVVIAISLCHLLNDVMQALLPAIYPNLKTALNLDFTHIGLVTLTFQLTASLLQPLVGLYADRRAVPYALPVAMLSTFFGLILLAHAHHYGVLLAAAALVGVGSSVFHPEASRVVHMAAGPRPGLAQSLFQTGGSFGGAFGVLGAAMVVEADGQGSVGWFAAIALLTTAILWRVGRWYATHGVERAKATHRARIREAQPRKVVIRAMAILLVLMFSKFVYLAGLGSYYTFYLIHKFGVSVQAAQIDLFIFIAAASLGTIAGGPIGDRFGRKHLIWFSILGTLPFAVALPYADLFWTCVLSAGAGVVLSSAFSAMVVYGQELVPGKIGMISGMFFGLSFGLGGVAAAALGWLADLTSIEYVFKLISYLPALGILAAFLPDLHWREKAKD